MSAGQITQGRHMPDGTEPVELLPGQYCKRGTQWWARTPENPEWAADEYWIGFIHNITPWAIMEHEDGTITASPSILIRIEWGPQREERSWHGFLEHGVWREC